MNGTKATRPLIPDNTRDKYVKYLRSPEYSNNFDNALFFFSKINTPVVI